MKVQCKIEGCNKVECLHHACTPGELIEHFGGKEIHTAEDNRRFPKQRRTIATHEIEGVVIHRDDDIKLIRGKFILIQLVQGVKILFAGNPLRIHELNTNIHVRIAFLQHRHDAVRDTIRPSHTKIIRVQNQYMDFSGTEEMTGTFTGGRFRRSAPCGAHRQYR